MMVQEIHRRDKDHRFRLRCPGNLQATQNAGCEQDNACVEVRRDRRKQNARQNDVKDRENQERTGHHAGDVDGNENGDQVACDLDVRKN